jgi:hypothetical protein
MAVTTSQQLEVSPESQQDMITSPPSTLSPTSAIPSKPSLYETETLSTATLAVVSSDQVALKGPRPRGPKKWVVPSSLTAPSPDPKEMKQNPLRQSPEPLASQSSGPSLNKPTALELELQMMDEKELEEDYIEESPPAKNKRLSSVSSRSHRRTIGTPVKEGHSNYMLMYDMLTGIRVAVSDSKSIQNLNRNMDAKI